MKKRHSVILKGISTLSREGSYQLQCGQLLCHTVDLNIALFAHIFHLLKLKVTQLKYGQRLRGLSECNCSAFLPVRHTVTLKEGT